MMDLNWMTLIGGVVGLVVPWMWLRLIPNDKVYEVFKTWGNLSSRFMTSKLGKGWNKIEDSMQSTLQAMYRGFTDGLNEDDE